MAIKRNAAVKRMEKKAEMAKKRSSEEDWVKYKLSVKKKIEEEEDQNN